MIPPPAYLPKVNLCYVYLLQSLKDGKFHIAWTTNIERRFREDNEGQSPYTKTRGQWQMIGYETFPNIESAKARERTLKHNPRMMFLFKKRLLNISQTKAGKQMNGTIPPPAYLPTGKSSICKQVVG